MTETPVTPPLEVKSQHGNVTATVELDPAVFGVQPNIPVMHQVVTAQLAAARAGTQSTKTRAEVSGGGAKPYRQKGTGRARQGSTRAPHYAGGGVALGPNRASYRQRTPRKMVQLALRCALSDRAAGGQVAVVDSWDWEVPSTKDAVAALSTLGLTGRVLVVLSREDERAYKSFRNISGIDLVLVRRAECLRRAVLGLGRVHEGHPPGRRHMGCGAGGRREDGGDGRAGRAGRA